MVTAASDELLGMSSKCDNNFNRVLRISACVG
jgi:hypothetical protein